VDFVVLKFAKLVRTYLKKDIHMTNANRPLNDDFAKQADTPTPGILREFIAFSRHNKKWWLLPIVTVLLLFGLLLVLGSSVAAPFIYTLF
jgi:hypothetical protein